MTVIVGKSGLSADVEFPAEFDPEQTKSLRAGLILSREFCFTVRKLSRSGRGTRSAVMALLKACAL
jgi:hypothetical protein